MEDRLVSGLNKLFKRHRVVFWYDDKQEFDDDFEFLSLPDVEKVRLNNNEFGVKYRILREAPSQKFLLYASHDAPTDINNWLLDVQLAHAVFHTDQAALWLAELGLGLEFRELVQEHREFFRSKKRKATLKSKLSREDTPNQIRFKMLAVCISGTNSFEDVMRHLLQDAAEEKTDRYRLITRCALDEFLWEQAERHIGYRSEAPSVEDFVITLFRSCYTYDTGGTPILRPAAAAFLRGWKDSRRFVEGFELLSARIAYDLNVQSDLETRDFRDLLKIDYFELVEKKILDSLVQAIRQRDYTAKTIEEWVAERRLLPSHWYNKYADLYKSLLCASKFFHRVEHLQLTMRDMHHAIKQYCETWFELDQLYRAYLYHARKANAPSLLKDLSSEIENYYSNRYLLRLNDAFSDVIEQDASWDAGSTPSQSSFFDTMVRPYLRQGNTVAVIISDAMRYEVGEELNRRIASEDRYRTEITPMLSMLPSYTQLGMASLLPNTHLEVLEDSTVLVDGQSATGSANREAILKKGSNRSAKVLLYSEVRDMKVSKLRKVVRENDLLYVYHDQIDAVGDRRDTEDRVFDAVADTLEELVSLIKHLNNGNVNNMLVTADHGFVYQNNVLDESEFSGDMPTMGTIYQRSRRYILGRDLNRSKSMHTFGASDIGLTGDIEVQVPKSINRLRVRGAGSRFVHGGASLQEVVVPVIRVNKTRETDVRAVDVEIIRGGSDRITTGQLMIGFYQAEPVTEKVQSRVLRAGIYTKEGELISDSHKLIFDATSDHSRDREQRVQFILTQNASEVKSGESVYLRLEEQVEKTTHYREYAKQVFIMQRSFATDFDL